MSTLYVLRSFKKVQFGTFRLFSTNSDFVERRNIYHDEVGVLRKQWKLEHEAKLEIKRLAAIEEDRKRVLVKAIKLRRIRAESVIKKEAARIQNAAVRLRVREQQARALLMHQARVEKQQRRYAGAIAELEKEKEHWLTRENLETRITEDLFATPATTGLISRYSELWRYSAYTTDLDRSMRDMEDNKDDDYEAMEIKAAGERDMGKRIEMIDFLDQSIANGHERANFKNLVNEFLDTFEDIADLEEESQYQTSDVDKDCDGEEEQFSQFDGQGGEEDENGRQRDMDSESFFNEEEELLDSSIDMDEAEDPGDYKKKVSDVKKKPTVGRKKK